jgi:hypothetical protein
MIRIEDLHFARTHVHRLGVMPWLGREGNRSRAFGKRFLRRSSDFLLAKHRLAG